MGFRGRWFAVLFLGIGGIVLYLISQRQCEVRDENGADTRPASEASLGRESSESRHSRIFGAHGNGRPLVGSEVVNGRREPGKRQRVPKSSLSPDMNIPGWIGDCVTWEKKWEAPDLDTDPHLFSADRPHLGVGEDPSHMRKTFQEIFDRRDWPAHDASYTGLQSSGPGAMLKNSQRTIAILHNIITRLKGFLRKSEISILDLPCGDLQWMSKFLVTRGDIRYTGADIVPDLIAHHRQKFSQIPKTTFLEWNIVEHPLNASYDLILTRDLLQHLWRVDALRVLDHFSRSGSSFLLTTTYPGTTNNMEVEKDALGSRKSSYNLELPPFSLVSPACMSYDWNVEHLALWAMPLQQKFEA